MKYFLDMKEEYSGVKNIPAGSEAYIGDVYFGYIPNGFKQEVMEESSTITLINFVNDSEYFRFKITKNKWNSKVNTEDTEVEEIVLNNQDMVFYENDEEKSLSWKENNKVLVLSSNCEKELLLHIAEHIKMNENVSPQN